MKTVVAFGIVIAASRIALAMDSLGEPQAIQEAIAIGQTTTSRDRPRFHATYHVVVAKPPVDYLEVVTPFRRVELEAESQMLQGSRAFGQRQAREVLTAAPDQLDVYVELTFNPLNAFVGVPDYTVTLAAADSTTTPMAAMRVELVPRSGARVDGGPLPVPMPLPGGRIGSRTKKPTTEPVLGGTIIAHFDTKSLSATGAYDVVVTERQGGRDHEIARGRVDLSRMR